MPTLKTIHIAKSHQPTHHQNLSKSMVLPTLTEQKTKKGQQLTAAMRQAGNPSSVDR